MLHCRTPQRTARLPARAQYAALDHGVAERTVADGRVTVGEREATLRRVLPSLLNPRGFLCLLSSFLKTSETRDSHVLLFSQNPGITVFLPFSETHRRRATLTVRTTP